MTPDTIFQICSKIAVAGWILLIFLPHWKFSDKFITGIIVTLFGMVYTWLVVSNFRLGDMQKFGSLQGVMQLFANPFMLTAGWIHYLAFDLMTGLFISKNAALHKISHWIVIPCLLFTFMLGPSGLLLYLVIRIIATKKYFSANFSSSPK